MNVTGVNTSEARSPRKTPRWVLVLVALSVLTVLGGALTVLLNSSEATFGWFAYAPMNGETFPGMTVLSQQAVTGWVGVGIGAVLFAFCAGWFMGRRNTGHR